MLSIFHIQNVMLLKIIKLVCVKIYFATLTREQMCCYYRWWGYQRNWWGWSLGLQWGSLMTSPTYESGSLVRLNSYWFDYYNYIYSTDGQAKKECCLESNMCRQFHQVRPINQCWGYRPPRWGKL